MVMATRIPPRRVEANEGWIQEWVEFGLRAFNHLLARHAEYVEWMRRHDRGGEE
jgi:hypothetical protein